MSILSGIEKAGGQTKIFGLHQCTFALYISQYNILRGALKNYGIIWEFSPNFAF